MTVILNPSAGMRKPGLDKRVAGAFAEHGLQAKLRFAGPGAEAAEIARRAVKGGERTVVAGGGDGTLNAVAGVLADSDSVFGVLPLGTLNHFAKDAGIPLDIEGAVRTIAEGHTASVDVGEVNGRMFLNNASLGLYPAIVVAREEQQRKGRPKWVALFWATLAGLRRFPFLSVRLSADGTGIRLRTPFLFVGNNEYTVEGLGLGTRAKLDTGYLWLYIARCSTRRCIFFLAARALAGRLREAREFDAMCVRELWVESPRPRLRIALDGEVAVMDVPLHFRIRPGALRIFVPLSAARAQGR